MSAGHDGVGHAAEPPLIVVFLAPTTCPAWALLIVVTWEARPAGTSSHQQWLLLKHPPRSDTALLPALLFP